MQSLITRPLRHLMFFFNSLLRTIIILQIHICVNPIIYILTKKTYIDKNLWFIWEYWNNSKNRYHQAIQHYVIKFVSDAQQVCGFLRQGTLVSSTNKTDRHDITEILLKGALNTITLTHNLNKLTVLFTPNYQRWYRKFSKWYLHAIQSD